MSNLRRQRLLGHGGHGSLSGSGGVMSLIQTWLRALLEFFRVIPKTQYKIRRSEEQLAPKDVAFNEIVIIGPRHHPKWVVFHCPGDCSVFYRLPIGGRHSPRWNIRTDWLGRPSAAPSVHQKSQCHAHFWVKSGGVFWCRGSGCGPIGRKTHVYS